MRSRKKKRSAILVIVLLIILIIGMATAGVLLFLYGKSQMLTGEWERKIDVTDTVRENIRGYIAESTLIDEINIDDYLGTIEVESSLVIPKEGSMKEGISYESYYDANEKAYDALENIVTYLLESRIKSNYIETDMTTDELIKETVGTDLEQYLKAHGPVLMPTIEELESLYGTDASYTADREKIIISNTGGDEENCDYAITNGMLVIDRKDGGVIYHKNENKQQETVEGDEDI